MQLLMEVWMLMKIHCLLILVLVALATCVDATPFEPSMCKVSVNERGEVVYPEGFSLERCKVLRFRKSVRR